MRALFLSIALLFTSPLHAEHLNLHQVSEAACKVTVRSNKGFGRSSTSYGSGTVVRDDTKAGKYYILTNAHVVGKTRTSVSVGFYDNGTLVDRVPGKVIAYYYYASSSIDIAVISVDKKSVKYKPRIIPIAPENTPLRTDQHIYGSGFPSGYWLQSWEARITSFNNNTINFNMPPLGGQSGSGICTTIQDTQGKKHTVLVGIVSWRETNGRYGSGVSFKRIYQVFRNRNVKRDRVNYIPVNLVEKDPYCKCGHRYSEHYYSYKNGKVYKKNGRPHLHCPGTHNIDELKNMETQCINGQCYPFSRPYQPYRQPPREQWPSPPNNLDNWLDGPNGPPPSNPPDLFPPANPLPAPTPTPKPNPIIIDPNQDLLRKISELQSRVELLQSKNAGYDGEIKLLRARIAEYEAQLAGQTNALESKDAKIKQQSATIETISTENTSLLGRIAGFAKDKANSFSLPFVSDFGPTGNVIAALIAIASGGGLMTFLYHRIGLPFLIKRFGWIPSKIISRILERKLGIKDENKQKVDELWGKYMGNEKKNDIDPPKQYNKVVPDIFEPLVPKTVKQSPKQEEVTLPVSVPTPTQASISMPTIQKEEVVTKKKDVHPHIKELFAEGKGKLMGMSPKEWAIKRNLYKQAVDMLREGRLEYQGKSVQDHEMAAFAIEDFVKNRFYTDIDMTKYNFYDEMYNIGYVAYLYYQATEMLKSGNLDTFEGGGHFEAAMAIEKWVKDKTYLLWGN